MNQKTAQNITEQIRGQIQAQGIVQNDMAAALGMSPSRLSNVINDAVMASDEVYQSMVEYLGGEWFPPYVKWKGKRGKSK